MTPLQHPSASHPASRIPRDLHIRDSKTLGDLEIADQMMRARGLQWEVSKKALLRHLLSTEASRSGTAVLSGASQGGPKQSSSLRGDLWSGA